jgi:hypothetical protein
MTVATPNCSFPAVSLGGIRDLLLFLNSAEANSTIVFLINNSWADLLLGIASRVSKVRLWEEITTQACFYRLYISDQWRVGPKLTVFYGLPWNTNTPATREDRGTELYNFNDNTRMISLTGNSVLRPSSQVTGQQNCPKNGCSRNDKSRRRAARNQDPK